MATELIANIKGPQGVRGLTGLTGPTGAAGAAGLAGVNGVANDTATGQYIGTQGSATQVAGDTRYVRRRGAAKNVQDYGVLGDGVTDDYAALQAVLNLGGLIFMPAGTYLISEEVKVKSNTTLYGAGIDLTVIKSMPSVDGSRNTLTNASNNRLARSNYDEYIVINDLTLDGNAANRTAAGSVWASCLTFAAVRHSSVERVKAINGYLHCFDVSASVYSEGTGLTVRPLGPSYNIVVRDCIAMDAQGDDCFTTHYSYDILIERCRATSTVARWNGQGIEIDEGSYRVAVVDCYVRGFAKGYQAKGHTSTPPAYEVSFVRCVADSCNMGFSIEANDPVVVPAAKGLARTVLIDDCTNMSNKLNVVDYPDMYGLQILGYENVQVRNFTSRDSVDGGILIHNGATDVHIDGVRGENVFTAPTSPDNGFIRWTGAAGDDISVRNVAVKGDFVGNVVRGNNSTNVNVLVDNVRATGANATYAAVQIASLPTTHVVRRVFTTGFLTGVKTSTGGIGESFDRSTDDTGWVPITILPGFTGANNPAVKRKNGVVYWRGQVTRDAGNFPASLTTIGTMPSDFFRPTEYSRFNGPAFASVSANSLVVVLQKTSNDIQVGGVGASSADLYLSPVQYPND